jgi:hypothetical protein
MLEFWLVPEARSLSEALLMREGADSPTVLGKRDGILGKELEDCADPGL